MKKNIVHDYVIYLQRPDYRRYDLASTILLLIAVIGMLFFAYYQSAAWYKYFIVAGLIIFQVLYNFRELRREETVSFANGFYIAAVAFLLLPGNSALAFITAICFILAAYLEGQLKFQEEIGFDSSGITFNSFPKKHFPWQAFRNVVLKDGILTLDFTNNKILQKEIDERVAVFLEAEFNDFCRAQLAVHTQLT